MGWPAHDREMDPAGGRSAGASGALEVPQLREHRHLRRRPDRAVDLGVDRGDDGVGVGRDLDDDVGRATGSVGWCTDRDGAGGCDRGRCDLVGGGCPARNGFSVRPRGTCDAAADRPDTRFVTFKQLCDWLDAQDDATLAALAQLRERLFRGWAETASIQDLLRRPARALFRLTTDLDALDAFYLRLLVPAAAALSTAAPATGATA